tara:strand:- start:7456 stop:7923 length:468 start_codon:yes stop_codon:yes gene_type:complete
MSDLAGDIVNLEFVDAPGTTLTGQDIGPGGFNSATEGCNQTHPGDDNATQFHIEYLRRLLTDSLGEKRNGIAEGLNAFRSVIWNLDREFFFKGHHQLDLVERVSTQIVDKASLLDNLLGIHVKVFHNDLADPISDIAHSLTSLFEIDVSFRFLLA